jgi:dTDP-4-amino-4,6-dideoxygalactose transaminase
MKVPFFDYTQIYEQDFPIYEKALDSVLKRADFILRDDLVQFEENLAKFVGVDHCVGVANGTDAIWLGLRAAGIGQGDEVILPSHTYVATADAVWAVGGTPVLVDIGDDHSISPDAIEEAINDRTAAIIPVNLNGRAAPLSDICKIAAKRNLVVIEDNAQGLGAKLDGKAAGTFGLLASLSFYPAKTLGGLGDGGGVLTNDADVAKKIKLLRSHGRDEQNEVVEWGFNSRLDNLQAAVLDAKLKVLDKHIAKRRHIADLYLEKLEDIQEIKLPQHQGSSQGFFVSYQNFEIEAKDRDELKRYLADNGVGTIIQWGGKGVHEFGLPGVKSRDLSNTERIIKSMLLLPMNHYLKDEQIDFVSKTIRSFYAQKSK